MIALIRFEPHTIEQAISFFVSVHQYKLRDILTRRPVTFSESNLVGLDYDQLSVFFRDGDLVSYVTLDRSEFNLFAERYGKRVFRREWDDIKRSVFLAPIWLPIVTWIFLPSIAWIPWTIFTTWCHWYFFYPTTWFSDLAKAEKFQYGVLIFMALIFLFARYR